MVSVEEVQAWAVDKAQVRVLAADAEKAEARDKARAADRVQARVPAADAVKAPDRGARALVAEQEPGEVEVEAREPEDSTGNLEE